MVCVVFRAALPGFGAIAQGTITSGSRRRCASRTGREASVPRWRWFCASSAPLIRFWKVKGTWLSVCISFEFMPRKRGWPRYGLSAPLSTCASASSSGISGERRAPCGPHRPARARRPGSRRPGGCLPRPSWASKSRAEALGIVRALPDGLVPARVHLRFERLLLEQRRRSSGYPGAPRKYGSTASTSSTIRSTMERTSDGTSGWLART